MSHSAIYNKETLTLMCEFLDFTFQLKINGLDKKLAASTMKVLSQCLPGENLAE
jgi:hypothetical protein